MTRLQSNRYEQLKKIHEEIIFHPKDLKATYNLLLYGPELYYAYELLPSIKDTIAHFLHNTCRCKIEAQKMGLEGPFTPLCPCDLLRDFLVNGNTLIPLFKLSYDEYKRFLKLHETTFHYLYTILHDIFPKEMDTFVLEQFYTIFALFLRKDFNFELLRTINAEDIEAIRDTLPKVQSGLHSILIYAEGEFEEEFRSYPLGAWDEKIAFHALYTIYSDGEPIVHYLYPKLENTIKHIIRKIVNKECKKAKINGRDRKALRKILY